MAVIVGFCCDVINCELALRDVRPGAAETAAMSSASTVYRGRSDVDPSSSTIFLADYSAPAKEQSIAISVLVSVHRSVCPLGARYLSTHVSKLHQTFGTYYLWPRIRGLDFL